MIKEFKKGDVIFREGETGDTLYQIKEGEVCVYAGYDGDDRQFLTRLDKGRFFGEMAVVESYPRSATAVAKGDVKVLEMNREEVMEFFSSNPDKIMEIMKGLSGRLRDLTNEYIDVCYTINEIRNNVERETGSALSDLIRRFAAVYKRHKTSAAFSVEGARRFSQSGHDDGYTVKVEDFDKGTVIFKEGEKGEYMYDILSGSVGIYDGYGTDNEKLITTLMPNMFFGELGMIDNVDRSATAVVMEKDTTLEIIAAADIPDLFKRNPSKVRMILEHLSYRVRELTREYLNACRMIYRISEAGSDNNDVNDGLKSEVDKYGDDLLVVCSLKL